MNAGGQSPDSAGIRRSGGRRARKRASAEEAVTAERLAAWPLFSLLDEALRGRLAPRVTHLTLARGETLFDGPPLPDEESWVFILLSGEVSVRHVGEPAAQAGPARSANGADAGDVVNYLRPGEPFVQKLFSSERTTHLRLEAMIPIEALRISYRDANYLLRKSEGFRDAFSAAIRGISDRQASRFDDGFQREISQFFVEQRLTFAGRVKIKRMDICIECDGCYDACRSRHGTDRLGASEVRYGLTEIPQNCHNCEVPECFDKCKFGHISRDPQTQEILISQDCIGCTLCAKGCSFDAIRMHNIADLDIARYFPNRSPDAKGNSIAQKCDNCAGYADKACITACPTGALFQVDGPELFNYWEQFNVHKTPGFDAVVSPEGKVGWFRAAWISFVLLNVLILTYECLGRLFWLPWTFGAALADAGLTEALDPANPFRAGDFFSHAMGYIGAGALAGTQLYRLRRWLAPRFGSVQAWMEAHIWLGVLGGVHGFFHTAFVFHEPVAVATFGMMMLAILTGVLGRYLLYLVPRSQAGHQLELSQLEGEIQRLNRDIEARFVDRRVGYTMMTRIENLGADDPASGGLTASGLTEASLTIVDGTKPTGAKGAAGGESGAPAAGWLRSALTVFSDARRQARAIDALAPEVRAAAQKGKANEVLGLLKKKARLERSVKRHSILSRLLKRYRIVHVVSSDIMFGALTLHIVISLMYSVGN